MRLRKKTTQKSQMKKKKIKLIAAAGGVVYQFEKGRKEPLVLLILRNGVWDIPKGKLEKGESIEMCAVREVAEETGTELPILISALGETYHEYQEKKKTIGKTTFWYSMIFGKHQVFTPQGKEGIEKVSWIPLSQAKEQVGFENLKQVLDLFEKSIVAD